MSNRAILAEIDGNRRRGCELSDEQKRSLVSLQDAGHSIREIMRFENLPFSTVQTTLQRIRARGTIKNAPRTGRPSIITPNDRRSIIRACREEPKLTYRELQHAAGCDFAPSTIKRALHLEGIHKERARRRPYLENRHAVARLAFARKYLHEDWSKWLFSDECSVEYSRGSKPQWSFNKKDDRYAKKHVQPFLKGPQKSLMIWGVIGVDIDRQDVVVMQRDPAAPRGGYSTTSYLDTLEEGLLPIYNGHTFMQDGAGIHRARRVRQFFEENGISYCSDWPSFSPDLNPIEHCWARLKDELYEQHPELLEPVADALQIELLQEYIPAAWRAISQDLVDALFESMPRRLQAVIDAGGWHTKY